MAARVPNQLTTKKCESRLEPGRYADGGGLYLAVSENGAKSWMFFWKAVSERKRGKYKGQTMLTRHAVGLGPFQDVSLADAREKATELRTKLREARREGGDVVAAVKRKPKASMTFGQATETFIQSREADWKHPKHRQQWRNSMATYAAPINDLSVAVVETAEVMECLKTIWATKREAARRVRSRIETVLDWAKANGYRQGENPARWRGHLNKLLRRYPKLVKGHHPAMAVDAIPAFMAKLRTMEGAAPAALEYLILTASRTNEVLGAKWGEIKGNVWIVPGERMKAGREHRVPLPDRALAILARMEQQRQLDSPYIFPGFKRRMPLSGMALEMVLRRMGVGDVTVHGYRSSFRDWAGDCTNFPRELIEFALAHKLPDKTEEAYRRSDALERRRKLMGSWANYCGVKPAKGRVLAFGKVRKAS
jgi:integrase